MLEVNLLSKKKKIGGGGYFIEELSNGEFTSYEEVSSLAGVTAGTLHNEGQGWLRFDYEGTELIVSKKTIRYALSWNQINNAGCVFGEKIVTINGKQYKVRLLTGVDTNPTRLTYGYHLEGSHNSEWSRLFYPLVRDDSTLNNQYTGPKDPRYTNLQLGMITENGRYSWCQETHLNSSSYRIIRGGLGVSYLDRYTFSTTATNCGWRPVLELI